MTHKNTQNKDLGHLLIYRMADVAVPYAKLEQLADKTGFDTKYVPVPPRPRNAWEKATNLKRQRLIAPPDFIEKVKQEHGCEPTIRAETKAISSEMRHIVRSVTIKAAQEREQQLDMKSVAILRFDDDQISDLAKFVGIYHPDFDPLSAVNGNIKVLIQRMQDEYQSQLTMADGQDVRDKVRKFLAKELKAKLLADGTYFVRDNIPGAEAKLSALQDYVLGLADFKTTQNVITCQIYHVADDGSAFSQRNKTEIKTGVIEQFKNELSVTLKKLTEPDSRGTQATEKRVREAGAEFLEMKTDIKAFQEALGDDLQALADLVTMCQNAMLKTMG